MATRKDFSASGLTAEQLDRIKLEDGIRLHEQVRTDLRIYAGEHDKPVVKPFLLVIARDTEHASRLMAMIQSKGFFAGRYGGRVIEVHSAQAGEEKEETVQRLLAVEKPDEPTEIVIHVNMLKEGWDVKNLYTIVPLRAANARTLIEQSIGRGLRLPYGRRTGVKAVDRLTIVAHDRFQEIVDEANRPESVIRRIDRIILDKDGLGDAPQPVEVQPLVACVLAGQVQVPDVPLLSNARVTPVGAADAGTQVVSRQFSFASPAARAIGMATLQVIGRQDRILTAAELLGPGRQERIVEAVRTQVPYDTEETLPGMDVGLEAVVAEATATYVALSIDVPSIAVVPAGEVAVGFEAFDLDTRDFLLHPVNEEILIHHLQSSRQERLAAVSGFFEETRLEDFVVSAVLDFDDVDYDSNSELLYRLAGQLVEHLRGYLANDAEVRNVLMYYQARIGHLVHAQMLAHRHEKVVGWEVRVPTGHQPLRPATVARLPGAPVRPFRVPVEDKRFVPQMVFGGFSKCLYPEQRFHSDPERRFSVLLEDDNAVRKWVKPAARSFQIQLRGGDWYEPDFVVEACDARYLVEVKRADLVTDKDVLSKAEAARVWCARATEFTRTTDGKPWRYVLLPDDSIMENYSLAWLAQQFGR